MKFNTSLFVVILTISSAVGLGVLNYQLTLQLTSLQQTWEIQGKQHLAVSNAIQKVVSNIGYGGLIHNVKLLISSADAARLPFIERDITNIEAGLAELTSQPLNEFERSALAQLKTTVSEYKSKLKKVTELDSGDWSSAEIIRLMQIEDTLALIAIDVLQKSLLQKQGQIATTSQTIINSLELSQYVVYFFIIVFLFLGIYSAGLLRKSVLANRIALEKTNFLNAMFAAAPDAIMIVNEEGLISQVNDNARNVFGFEEDELIGSSVDMLLTSTSLRKKHQSHRENYLRKPETRRMGEKSELFARNKNGNVFPVDISLSSFKAAHNSQLWVIALARDVSQQKKLESDLKTSQSLLLESQKIGRMATWEWDPESKKLKFSESIKQLLGIENIDLNDAGDTLAQYIHPDDLELVSEVVEQSAQLKKKFQLSYRIINSENQILHIRSIARPYREKSDEKFRLLGVLQDITEDNRVQNELARSAIVFDNSKDAIIVTDANNEVIAVNNAYSDITGYEEAEVLGKRPGIATSGFHDDEFYDDLWQSLTQNGGWEGEIWDRRKNGELYPKWVNINTIKDHLGGITNYVAIYTDITKLKENEEKLWQLAHHDPLTGLANRSLFKNELESAMIRSDRSSLLIAIIFIDLDGFKKINDTLGHEAGDQLLLEVSRRFKQCLRSEDIASRHGGDEFTILLENLHNRHDAFKLATKLQMSMDQPITLSGQNIYVNASMGISVYPEDGVTVSDLLKFADVAMYRAKNSGRNKIDFFNENMNEGAEETLKLEQELNRALSQNQFTLHYQPQYNLEHDLIGLEALIRWNHPRLGLLYPDSFIPLAEESDKIISIGQWVLDTVCQQLSLWKKQGIEIIPIAVNIGAKHFEYGNVVTDVSNSIIKHGVSGDLLDIEITETTAMNNEDRIESILQDLKVLGIKLSVDDFGTGYSSLQYLKKFPFDRLKIDKTFVQGIPHDSVNVGIVRSIIAIADCLNLTLIAEGVETKEQADYLIQESCRNFQGYYFSRPLSMEQVEHLLVSHS